MLTLLVFLVVAEHFPSGKLLSSQVTHFWADSFTRCASSTHAGTNIGRETLLKNDLRLMSIQRKSLLMTKNHLKNIKYWTLSIEHTKWMRKRSTSNDPWFEQQFFSISIAAQCVWIHLSWIFHFTFNVSNSWNSNDTEVVAFSFYGDWGELLVQSPPHSSLTACERSCFMMNINRKWCTFFTNGIFFREFLANAPYAWFRPFHFQLLLSYF